MLVEQHFFGLFLGIPQRAVAPEMRQSRSRPNGQRSTEPMGAKALRCILHNGKSMARRNGALHHNWMRGWRA